jgi:hypothetical protein
MGQGQIQASEKTSLLKRKINAFTATVKEYLELKKKLTAIVISFFVENLKG